MRVDVLCSGSKGNCTVVRTAAATLMIDCGSTKKYLFSALDQIHVKREDIQALLVTHCHSDHVSQLKWFSSQPVYSWCRLKIEDTRIPVEPFESFDVGDIHITPIALSHDAGHTLGYILEAEGKKLVYVTDTGYFQNSYLDLIADADIFIFESNHDVEMLMDTARPLYLKQRILSAEGHLCNEDAAAILSKACGPHTKDIVLAHLSDEANEPSRALSVLYDTFERKNCSLDKVQVQTASQYEILTIER